MYSLMKDILLYQFTCNDCTYTFVSAYCVLSAIGPIHDALCLPVDATRPITCTTCVTYKPSIVLGNLRFKISMGNSQNLSV